MSKFTYIPLYYIIFLAAISGLYSQQRTTLYTSGRYLYTPCEDLVTLRGVNKMIVWTGDLKLRKDSYAEIKKTGANCVRIVWLAQPSVNEIDAGPDGLDRTIQDCIDNRLIPMVELHDATGDWSKLQSVVDYWVSETVLPVIKKHENYLIINIANECGDDQVTNEQFKSGYEQAVNSIRKAGIKCPLVIDATDWGHNLAQLRETGPYLINADPEHNLIFSVHTYWAVSDGANEKFITDEFLAAVNIELPFIVGEFTYKFNKDQKCEYETDYKAIIKLCAENQIGFLPWEWGPGNEYFNQSCDIMNMTADSYFSTLRDGWAKEVAVTSPYSIMNTSSTPDYIKNKGKCNTQGVFEGITQSSVKVSPNPAEQIATVTLLLDKGDFVSGRIYNILGSQVGFISEGYLEPGLHTFNIEFGSNYSEGIYYCTFDGKDFHASAKLLHLR